MKRIVKTRKNFERKVTMLMTKGLINNSGHRAKMYMFVDNMVGLSMEPAISITYLYLVPVEDKEIYMCLTPIKVFKKHILFKSSIGIKVSTYLELAKKKLKVYQKSLKHSASILSQVTSNPQKIKPYRHLCDLALFN